MMKLQIVYKFHLLLIIFFHSSLNALEIDVICNAADPGTQEISVSFVSYLSSDGYTNKSVRTCKNSFNPNSCEDGISNFKYCKNPRQTFFIKTLNQADKTFVVEDRCDTGFKKFKLVGSGDDEEIILIDEKMYFQIKNQIWGGAKIEALPALIIKKLENSYDLTIESFTEDHWIEEWQRDDIDISFFATPIEKAISFKTSCN